MVRKMDWCSRQSLKSLYRLISGQILEKKLQSSPFESYLFVIHNHLHHALVVTASLHNQLINK
jgi:hypothetical protein